MILKCEQSRVSASTPSTKQNSFNNKKNNTHNKKQSINAIDERQSSAMPRCWHNRTNNQGNTVLVSIDTLPKSQIHSLVSKSSKDLDRSRCVDKLKIEGFRGHDRYILHSGQTFLFRRFEGSLLFSCYTTQSIPGRRKKKLRVRINQTHTTAL